LRSVPRAAARAVAALLACGAGPLARAQTLAVELMTGSAYNFPTPLTVHQSGYPDLNVTAHYDTRPFGHDFPYYALRISRWDGDGAWEFEQLHHRLFLSHPPPEIQDFSIHYGYNYLLFGYAWRRDGLVLHLGAGPILTNPESTVRHQTRPYGSAFFDGGWYYSGIGMAAAAEKTFPLTTRTFFIVEVALSTGFAWSVPIENGSANVRNVALHGHIGLGYTF
jgi:hypothetical protein